MTGKTVAMKVTSLAGQVVLAWLLLEEDFGLYALALTVYGVGSLVHQAGVREVLIHRQASFERWATAGFWLSLTLGTAAASLIVGLAPIAARIYDEPGLTPLLWILALGIPLKSLEVVPRTLLQNQLRFAPLALVGLVSNILEVLGAITLAFLGFGALSFVIPKPIVYLMQSGVTWGLARPHLRRGFEFRKWRHLVDHSVLSLVAAFLAMAIMQGDYILLGLLFPAQMVGIYYFAYRLSSQTLSVFNANMAQVLLPALSKYTSDPSRQIAGFLSGLKTMALITVPVCLLQAALAEPVVGILFEERWAEAIPLIQILSVGMAFHAVGGNTGSTLLRAQGRFSTLVWVLCVRATVFFLAVGIGAHLGGLEGAAFGVLAFMVSTGAFGFTVAVLPGGGDWLSFWRVILPPLLLGAFAVGASVILANSIPEAFSSNALSMIIIVVTSGSLYLLGAAALLRSHCDEFRRRLEQVWKH